jgi:hypothetical protein
LWEEDGQGREREGGHSCFGGYFEEEGEGSLNFEEVDVGGRGFVYLGLGGWDFGGRDGMD